MFEHETTSWRSPRSKGWGTVVIALAIPILFTAAAYAFGIGPVTLKPARYGTSQVCGQCPVGETGCAPDCSSGGGCSPQAYLESYDNSAVQSGYRQVWINWTYNTGTPSISWHAVGGGGLAVPELTTGSGSASVDLNALSADTTYDWTVATTNSCDTSSGSGSFSTSAAPTAGFVGWVSQLVSNAHLIDQDGPALSGANVWPIANCQVGYEIGSGINQKWGFQQEAFGLPATSTSSSGYYQLNLPDTYTTTLSEWLGGADGYQVTDTETIALSSGGSCVTALDGSTQYSVNNPDISLYANSNSFWNETRWVSSTLSASNDYQPFVELADGGEEVPLGVAFVHTSYAQCGFSMYSSSSTTTIYQLVTPLEGVGTTESTGSGSWANGLTNWGSNNAINPIYPFSGTINETSSSIMNTYTVGGFNQNVNTVPYWSSDWLAQPSPLPATRPTNYHVVVLNTGYDTTTAYYQFGTFTSGTYASWLSYGVEFDVSVGNGFAISTPVVNLGWSDQVSTSLSNSMYCNVYAPVDSNGGYAYFYWFNQDSGAASEITHVWFEGYCGGSDGEQACPGSPV